MFPRCLALVTLLLAMLPAPAAAQCCTPAPVDQAYAHASAVFVGTVTSSRDRLFSKNGYRTRLHVDEAFKGTATGQTYTILSNYSICGGFFREGARYLVYASGNEEIPCPRTRYIPAHVQDDEVQLLRSLAAENPAHDHSAPTHLLVLLVVAALLFVILVLLFNATRQERPPDVRS